jgi:hypothetical protein
MRRAARVAANAAGLLIASLIAAVGVEAGYRVYLYHDLRARLAKPEFAPDAKPTFVMSSYPAFWVYDRVSGFNLRPGVMAASIKDGRPAGCEPMPTANRNGNIGTRDRDLTGFQAKVFVFGSSHTLVGSAKRALVTDVAEDIINRERARPLIIENFSRDSYGLTQMMDFAAREARERRPDLVLFAFNSSDVARPRVWRSIVSSGGGFYRLYHSLTAESNNDDPAKAVLEVTRVISDAITPKWCADIAEAIRTNDTARLTSDAVLVGAIDQFNRNRTLKATPKIAVNFWAPNVSFALNMARHGTPYYRMRLASYDATWSTISIDDFASDPQFMKSLNDLRATGIPFSFIHMPMYPELAAGQEWMFDRFGVQNEQGARLVASLERLTGQKVHSILSALRASVPDPETFPKKAREPRLDWHPAPSSVQPIGAALAQFIKAQYPALASDAQRADR